VHPAHQGRGIGRWCLDEAARIVRAHPGDAIFLDAYDAEAGAGGFYARCGFREVARVLYRGTPLVYYELMVA
jgi:ribosomal protein S18 acetylase RimI-like enzyme